MNHTVNIDGRGQIEWNDLSYFGTGDDETEDAFPFPTTPEEIIDRVNQVLDEIDHVKSFWFDDGNDVIRIAEDLNSLNDVFQILAEMYKQMVPPPTT